MVRSIPTLPGLAVDFATLDLLPYGIIVTDRDGEVLYYNQREEQIAQRSRIDVVGRNFFRDIAPCTQVAAFQNHFEQAVTANVAATFGFVFPFADNPRTVEISITAFEHQGRRLCLISVNDKTEEERVRTEILKSERFRELGEVAASVAHNFNNLLAIVRGNAELILAGPSGPDQKACCGDIIAAADDGAALVKRISQTAKGESSAPVSVVLINPLVLDAVATFRRMLAPDTHLDTDLAADVLASPVTASELREALNNLLRNAVDATATRSDRQIHVSTTVIGTRIKIAVRDNGTGMSPDVKRRLFQPLFSTKGSGGTGLGLASSLGLMQRFGGTIDVESSEGEGSEFSILLPHVAPHIPN